MSLGLVKAPAVSWRYDASIPVVNQLSINVFRLLFSVCIFAFASLASPGASGRGTGKLGTTVQYPNPKLPRSRQHPSRQENSGDPDLSNLCISYTEPYFDSQLPG